jgi:transposase InsO family protein
MKENQKEMKMKNLKSDRGDEYFSREFYTLYEENKIIHQMITPYTPQHSEKKNRILMDMVNVMLLNAKLPNNFLG